jgi:hypothetical protein
MFADALDIWEAMGTYNRGERGNPLRKRAHRHVAVLTVLSPLFELFDFPDFTDFPMIDFPERLSAGNSKSMEAQGARNFRFGPSFPEPSLGASLEWPVFEGRSCVFPLEFFPKNQGD